MKYQPPFKYGATPASAGIHNDDADASYINGDPSTGTEGSYIPAEAAEHAQRELVNLIERAGITPAHDNLEQAASAIAMHAAGGAFFGVDGGTANAAVLTSPAGASGFAVPTAFFDGMTVVYMPTATNTGATTCNAWGLGAKPVYDWLGNAVTGGELVADRFTTLVYDPALNGASGGYRIPPWADAKEPQRQELISVEAQSLKSQTFAASTVVTVTDYTTLNSNLGDATFSGGILTVGPETAGLWQCQVTVSAKSASTPASATQAYISKNDSTAGINSFVDTVAGTFASVSGMVRVADGETIRSKLWHNGVGTTKNEFSNGDGGIFYAYRISA